MKLFDIPLEFDLFERVCVEGIVGEHLVGKVSGWENKSTVFIPVSRVEGDLPELKEVEVSTFLTSGRDLFRIVGKAIQEFSIDGTWEDVESLPPTVFTTISYDKLTNSLKQLGFSEDVLLTDLSAKSFTRFLSEDGIFPDGYFLKVVVEDKEFSYKGILPRPLHKIQPDLGDSDEEFMILTVPDSVPTKTGYVIRTREYGEEPPELHSHEVVIFWPGKGWAGGYHVRNYEDVYNYAELGDEVIDIERQKSLVQIFWEKEVDNSSEESDDVPEEFYEIEDWLDSDEVSLKLKKAMDEDPIRAEWVTIRMDELKDLLTNSEKLREAHLAYIALYNLLYYY